MLRIKNFYPGFVVVLLFCFVCFMVISGYGKSISDYTTRFGDRSRAKHLTARTNIPMHPDSINPKKKSVSTGGKGKFVVTSVLTPDREVFFTYDKNGKLLSQELHYKDWAYGNWVTFSKITYTYDTLGNRNELLQYWVKNNWVNGWEEVTIPEENGKVTTRIVSDWENNGWVVRSSESKLNIDAQELLDYLTYNIYDSTGQNIIYTVEEKWEDLGNGNFCRVTYTYNSDGLLISKLVRKNGFFSYDRNGGMKKKDNVSNFDYSDYLGSLIDYDYFPGAKPKFFYGIEGSFYDYESDYSYGDKSEEVNFDSLIFYLLDYSTESDFPDFSDQWYSDNESLNDSTPPLAYEVVNDQTDFDKSLLYDTTNLVNYKKCIYTYDSTGALTSLLIKSWENNTWEDEVVQTYSYNVFKKLSAVSEKVSLEYSQQSFRTRTYTYDSAGNILSISLVRKNFDKVLDSTDQIFTYNSENNLTNINEKIWHKGKLISSRITAYEYNTDEKLSKEKINVWYNDSLIFSDTISYTYNSNGKLVQKSTLSFLTDDLTSNKFLNNLDYLLKNLDSSVINWEFLNQGAEGDNIFNIYDESGNLIKKTTETQELRVTPIYDESGNLIGGIAEENRAEKNIYIYDKSGNLLEKTTETQDSKTTLIYDNSGNLIEEITETIKTNKEVTPSTKINYTYDETGNTISVDLYKYKNSKWVLSDDFRSLNGPRKITYNNGKSTLEIPMLPTKITYEYLPEAK